ncbi:phage tail spike protein [Streptococcus suis]|uniref:phage tail spike protein n=1 Tax=Streptococcus suis TaxID=1307 RepID=UPI000CF5810C|nr:phage tail spike protein [Streptococcus suis]
MLYLLDKDVKIVKWNGIPLHEASSAIVKEEVNGDFVLTVRYPITDSSIYQLIKEDMLIKAPTPVLGPQLFRIKKPVENDDSLDITAYHITDDIMQRSINPVSVVGQGCAMALSQMVQNAKTDLGTFSFTSDIMDSRTFNTTDAETLYSVLLDGKHSIVGTWEGELVRDNFALTIKRSRGADRGVVITTHKNLKAYQRTRDSQGVVTRIHARSTFRAEGAEEETTITVTVDSPLIGNYPYINEKEYQNNDIHSAEELRKWAERKFKYENIDKPTDEIKIEAYELDGQVVHLGDTVNIKSRKHDVDLYKKAIAYEYNALTEEYISITFDDTPGVGGSGVSSGLSNAADVILGVNANAQEVAIERAVRNANQAFDAEFEKRVEEINDGIEQAKAEAELYADNIRQSIDADINAVNQSMQTQSEEHDRQVADILSKTQSIESLANQAKSDAASALARANQVKTEAVADARAQVATVSQALNTAKTELQTAIANADQKARDSQASATALRNDLNLQASKILAQAQAQTALTNRVSTVETLADGTRSTVAELSKTVSKATGDIASVTSRTKTVEDTLSQTRTQYEALTQTVNTQTGQIDSINRKTADLQSGIDGVTERFESLRIEDNLLLNSSFNENLNQWQGTGVTIVDGKARITGEFNKTKHIYQSIKSQIANDDVSQVYIAAISVKVSNYVAGRNPFFALYIDGRKNDSRNTQFGGTYLTANRLDAVNNRGIVQFATTFRINVPRNQIKLLDFRIYARDFTGEVEFEKVSLRRGNIDLGWQASPEDLRSEIATYKRTAEESSAELSRQIQTVDGKAVDAKTYAQQTAEGFKTRLESLETYKNAEGARVEQYFTASRDETARQVSALRVAVTQDYVAKSVFEETARGISQRFESLYVGGTNLLTGTDEYTEIFNSEQSHAEFLRTPYDLAPVFDKYGLIEYTLSFDLRASQAGQVAVYQQNGSGSKYSGLWKNLTVTTEWQRFHVTFTPTEGTVSLANSYLAFYGTYGTGVKPIIRRAKIERGAIATDWSPAPEELATVTALHDVKDTVSSHTRTIGAVGTAGSILDNISKVTQTANGLVTEVSGTNGLKTQVSTLAGSYAVKNLNSSGDILSQANLSSDLFLLEAAKIRLKGKTLADEIQAIDGKFETLFVADGTFAKLNATVIGSQAITADKLKVDQAFFDKLIANDAYLKQLFAKSVFTTQVQAVTLSASKISGGILTATNKAMEVNLNAGQILYYTDQAALKRVLNGYPTQFVKFATGTVSGKGNAGVTVIGSNRWNSESSNDGGFVGIRAWNGANIDQIDVVGDTVRLASSAFKSADGWSVNTLPGKLDIDAFNAEHRASSKIKVGDLWLWKNATTYSSMRDTINLIIDNLQLLHNNKSTERGYSYTLPAKV